MKVGAGDDHDYDDDDHDYNHGYDDDADSTHLWQLGLFSIYRYAVAEFVNSKFPLVTKHQRSDTFLTMQRLMELLGPLLQPARNIHLYKIENLTIMDFYN